MGQRMGGNLMSHVHASHLFGTEFAVGDGHILTDQQIRRTEKSRIQIERGFQPVAVQDVDHLCWTLWSHNIYVFVFFFMKLKVLMRTLYSMCSLL